MGETNTPLQELWQEKGGGLMRKGGVLAGFYSINYV